MNHFRQKDNLIGQANSFVEVLEQVSQLAALHKPVLIIGERGTGKELIAARLHYLSSRWDQSYVTLNCAALNENLLESELFGHESGAFTGAGKRHEGRFERANSGTLFLDELANTSGLVQEKLLRVIEYGEFERVGGTKTVKIDTRLVCATNEDLPALAEAGEFRSDLLDRLAFDVITLPPLRERREDIMILAEHFAISMVKELGWELFSGFSRRAKEFLMEYHWPGNVRELKNVVERSVYRAANPHVPVHEIVIDPFDSPFRPKHRIKTQDRQADRPQSVNFNGHNDYQRSDSGTEQLNSSANANDLPINKAASALESGFTFPLDFKTVSQEFEVKLLKQALASCQYNQKKTAEMLSVTYHQLRGYLKKYNLLDSNGEN